MPIVLDGFGVPEDNIKFYINMQNNSLMCLPNTPIKDRITINLENTQVQMPTLEQGLPNTQIEDRITNLENTQVQLPTLVQDFQTETLQDWTSKLAKFVITTATQYIYKCIQENNLILIVGPTGSGKSANAYHVAFRLKEESGYTVIPARQSTDITHCHIPDTKQVFIIDDFIGKFAVDEMNAGLWEQNWSLLNMILSDNINTKLILTIRTYVWQSERYKYLSMSACTCDLLSDKISLSLTERWCICKSYLNQTDMETLKDDTILMYSFLPSLCSSYMSYESSNNISVEQFLQFLLRLSRTKYITLRSNHNHEYDELVKDVFDESAFLQYPSKSLLMSSLVAFTGSYVKKTSDSFMLTNEKLQSIVLRSISKLLIRSVIKHCQTEVVLNQIRLDCFIEEHNVLTIAASNENEDTYFRRLADEVGGENTQMVNKKDSNGNIPLHIACMKGHMKIVKLLVENKSFIDIANKEGLKPFYYACENGYTQIAKYLLHHSSSSINVNEKYKKRNHGSVLHIASAKGFMELVNLLLKFKADANIQDAKGCTPLHLASNITVVRALLNSKANINAVDFLAKVLYIMPVVNMVKIKKEFFNSLLKTMQVSIRKQLQDSHLFILLVNLDVFAFKANVNAINAYGWTALFLVCSEGFREIVLILLKRGANPNIIDKDKVSPLIAACKENHTEVVDILLNSKANVNHCDKDNCSSLFNACKTGDIDLVRVLLRYSADINLADKDMITPLHAACMSNNNTKLILKLVESNANVNIADKTGQTPLFKSICNGYTDIVDILLRHGASVDIRDKSGFPP
ncbi:unnamed protein product [Mytilus edulis]|uniref:Novel STAND NTPase 3 domain-containing protein n=1 Tax=Mytilus edulis TaxID=6550 RepID=A0A8S3SCA4_MYTED|nr:unnamed protein product [Mytilus edulis]